MSIPARSTTPRLLFRFGGLRNRPSAGLLVAALLGPETYPICLLGCAPLHVKHTGTTQRGETVGCSSCGIELSPGGRSTKMISDSCAYANRKVLVKGVGENLLPTAQSGRLWPAWPVGSGSRPQKPSYRPV
jgi:hypothetical protein